MKQLLVKPSVYKPLLLHSRPRGDYRSVGDARYDFNRLKKVIDGSIKRTRAIIQALASNKITIDPKVYSYISRSTRLYEVIEQLTTLKHQVQYQFKSDKKLSDLVDDCDSAIKAGTKELNKIQHALENIALGNMPASFAYQRPLDLCIALLPDLATKRQLCVDIHRDQFQFVAYQIFYKQNKVVLCVALTYADHTVYCNVMPIFKPPSKFKIGQKLTDELLIGLINEAAIV